MTTELTERTALALPDETPDFRFRRSGILLFEICIESPTHGSITAQVHALNVIYAYKNAQANQGRVVELPVALLSLDNGLVFAKPFGGTPATLRLPTSLLEKKGKGGSLWQQAHKTIRPGAVTHLEKQRAFCGDFTQATVGRTDKSRVLIVHTSTINIADMSSQRDHETTYVFDPAWRGTDPDFWIEGTVMRQTFASQGALAYLREQLARTKRVAAEITGIFRNMTPDKPPSVSVELKRELGLLGREALEGWQRGALEGDANAVRQLQGRQADLAVGVPMREQIYDPGFPHERIRPYLCFLPFGAAVAFLKLAAR